MNTDFEVYGFSASLQVRPLNVDGSLNLLGLETVRLIYFRNKMAGKTSPVYQSRT